MKENKRPSLNDLYDGKQVSGVNVSDNSAKLEQDRKAARALEGFLFPQTMDEVDSEIATIAKREIKPKLKKDHETLH